MGIGQKQQPLGITVTQLVDFSITSDFEAFGVVRQKNPPDDIERLKDEYEQTDEKDENDKKPEKPQEKIHFLLSITIHKNPSFLSYLSKPLFKQCLIRKQCHITSKSI